MKLRTKILAATSAALLSTSAMALDFDLRLEYKDSNATSDGNAEHAGRFKFGHTFKINKEWKSNLSLETKFKSDDPEDFMTKVYIHEMELDMGLTYNLGNGWELKPGMPINTAFDEPLDNGGDWFKLRKVTYKPQLRVQHTWKASSFKWKNALRYRHEFAQWQNGNTESTYPCGDSSCKVSKENTQQYKVTLTGQFTPKALKKLYFAWEGNYWESLSNVKKGQEVGDESDWDFGVFLGYRFGNWRPYVEAWNIKNSSLNNPKNLNGKRGNKYRLGLKYYWK